MKPAVAILIFAAFLGFMGLVVMSTMGRTEISCEVCLVFDGTEVCRRGSGPTEAEALAAAQQSACGGNTSGMADAIACANRPPDRATCSAGSAN